jgi:hypothetical protein
MLQFLFGKKKKRSVPKPPPRKIMLLAKKYGVKVSLKRGSKVVYKPLRVIKKQITRNKKLFLKKDLNIKKAGYRRVKSRFGGMRPGVFEKESDFGYKQDARQVPGIPSYTNSVIPNNLSNLARVSRARDGMEFRDTRLPKKDIPIYGVGKVFFNQVVPGNMSPSWNAMGQPDGTLLQVGWPFAGYKKAEFGKKRRKSVKPSKPSAKLLKMCKKLKIKVTMKRGGKRVYKSEKQLKKALKNRKN